MFLFLSASVKKTENGIFYAVQKTLVVTGMLFVAQGEVTSFTRDTPDIYLTYYRPTDSFSGLNTDSRFLAEHRGPEPRSERLES